MRLSVYTLQLKDPLVHFVSIGYVLTASPFIFSLRKIIDLPLFVNNNKGPFCDKPLWHLMAFVYRCAFKPSFIL